MPRGWQLSCHIPCIALQVSQGAAGSSLVPLAAGAVASLADQPAEAGEGSAVSNHTWMPIDNAASSSVPAAVCAPATRKLHDCVSYTHRSITHVVRTISAANAVPHWATRQLRSPELDPEP